MPSLHCRYLASGSLPCGQSGVQISVDLISGPSTQLIPFALAAQGSAHSNERFWSDDSVINAPLRQSKLSMLGRSEGSSQETEQRSPEEIAGPSSQCASDTREESREHGFGWHRISADVGKLRRIPLEHVKLSTEGLNPSWQLGLHASSEGKMCVRNAVVSTDAQEG